MLHTCRLLLVTCLQKACFHVHMVRSHHGGLRSERVCTAVLWRHERVGHSRSTSDLRERIRQALQIRQKCKVAVTQLMLHF